MLIFTMVNIILMVKLMSQSSDEYEILYRDLD